MNILLINIKDIDELIDGCGDDMVREMDCPADTIAVVDRINGMIERLIHDFDLLIELIEEKELRKITTPPDWIMVLAEKLVDVLEHHPDLIHDCSGEVNIRLLNRFGDVMMVVNS